MIDEDPIEELHRIRRELYSKAGGTPDAYVEYLRSKQKERQKSKKKKPNRPSLVRAK